MSSIPIIGKGAGMLDEREIHVTLKFQYPPGMPDETQACQAVINQILIPATMGLGPIVGISAKVIHPPPIPPPPGHSN